MTSTIIIRLQNLPLTAKASDIREFFHGLRIPEGQVNIVGGPEGDAFIGFATDEDARRGMSFDGRELHGYKIRLLLSSKVEMEQVIANARAMAAAILGKSLEPFSKAAPVKQEPPKPPEIRQSYRSEGHQNGAHKDVPKYQSSAPIPSDSWKIPAPAAPRNTYSRESPERTPEYGSFFNSRKPAEPHGGFQHSPTNDNKPVYPTPNQPYNGPKAPVEAQPASRHGGLLPTPTAPSVKPTMTPNLQAFEVAPAFLPGFGPQPTHQTNSLDAPLYVQLRRLPAELFRPTALEQFLRPNVPLTLSSVKVVFDQNGQPMHAFVRFSDINDCQRVLERDGELGIRIRQCTRQEFEEAVDGTLGVVPGVPHSKDPRRQSPQRDGYKRRGSPPRHDDRARRRPRTEKEYSMSPVRSHASDDRTNSPIWKTGDQDSRGGSREKSHSRNSGDVDARNERLRRSRSPLRRREPSARFCVELRNVPHKARHMDVEDYVKLAKVSIPWKFQRTYYENGGNERSDKWVLEFDSQQEAEAVVNLNRMIHGRSIRARFISPREADDQYAIPGPDGASHRPSDRRDSDSRDDRSTYQRAPRDRDQREPQQNQSWVSTDRRRDSGDSYPPSDRLQRDRGWRNDNHRQDYDRPSNNPQPPPLDAKTEDELIVRGDLPPTAFGAFNAPTLAKSAYFKKTTGDVKFTGHLPRPPMNGPRTGAAPAPRQPLMDQQGPRPLLGDAPMHLPQQQHHQSMQQHQPPQHQPPQMAPQPLFPQGQERQPFGQQRDESMDTGFRPPPQPAVINEKWNASPMKEESWVQNKPLDQSRNHLHESAQNWDKIQPLNSTSQPGNGHTYVPTTEPLQIVETHKDFEPAIINRETDMPKSEIPQDNLPKLPFLEVAEANPGLKTCLRLRNIQQKITSERLCIFLGVVLERPAENVFWMPDGELYVNLSNEQLAERASMKNGRPLDGRLINVERITRGQMAEVVRKNLNSLENGKL